MPTLSRGAHMAWQLAAREAMRTRHPYIEKEGIFIGLCQLGTCLRAMKTDDRQISKKLCSAE